MNWIHGYHAIEEMIKQNRQGTLLVAKKSNERARKIIALARKKRITLQTVEERELDQYCDRKRHKGLLFQESGVSRAKGKKDLTDYKEAVLALEGADSLVLLLDSITDPHNFGAILRSADQFGVDLVITTEKRSARETETVASTSAGAVAYVDKAIAPNLVQVMEFLKEAGYWIYGADMSGEAVGKAKLTGKVALVMGSEGKGLRRLVQEKCDFLVSIPTRGNVDSLNVSVATGILLYEIRRQQG